MTPKEKAQDLINRFQNHVPAKLSYLEFGGDDGTIIKDITIEAKECAKIAVYELIHATLMDDFWLSGNMQVIDIFKQNYWREVLNEIENL